MKNLLVLIFVLIGASSYAQISLTLSDIGAPTRTYNERVDTAADVSIVPGAPGTNLTWNFAALHSTLDTSSVDFINTSLAPLHSLFPTSNFAARFDSVLNYYYFNRSATALTMQGGVSDYMRSGDSIKIVLSIPDTIVKLPAHYGDSFTCFSFGDSKSGSHITHDTTIAGFPVTINIDSVRVKHMQIKTSTMDAWGNVTTPTRTFPALRQKEIAMSIDSLWGYAVIAAFPTYNGWHFISVRNDTTDTYNWWMNQLGITAIKMTMVKQTAAIQRIDWVYDVYAGVDETNVPSIGVYPNPADNFIKISNTKQYNEMVIYDVLGNELKRLNIENHNDVSVPVSNLANGMYFYNLNGKADKASGKFVVKH